MLNPTLLMPLLLTSALVLGGCAQPVLKGESSGMGSRPPCQNVQAAGIFSKIIKLKDGRQLVVSEGQYEPKSIGSVTVLLYRDLTVGDFSKGLSFTRDGFVTAANLESQTRLKITTTSAGSGSYQQDYWVCIGGDSLSLC